MSMGRSSISEHKGPFLRGVAFQKDLCAMNLGHLQITFDIVNDQLLDCVRPRKKQKRHPRFLVCIRPQNHILIRQAIDICKDYCTNTCYCIHLEYVSDEFIDDVDGTVKLALLE